MRRLVQAGWGRWKRERAVVGRVLAAVLLVGFVANCGDGGGSGGGGSGAGSPTGGTGGTPPDAPTDIVATAGDGQVSLTWIASAGAAGYTVYYGTAATESKASHENTRSASASPAAIGSIANDTTYYFTLTASSADGESVESVTVSATPAATPAPPAQGILDPSFNSTGIVNMTGTVSGTSGDTANAVLLDAQGRIVVVGKAVVGTTTYVAVWRYLTTGLPDTSFNGTGSFTMTTTSGGGTADVATAAAVDSQGRIIVVGQSNQSMAVWRLIGTGANAGQLDTSFNGTGYFTMAGAAGGTVDFANAVAVDAGDNVAVAGYAYTSGFTPYLVVWRLLGSGVNAGHLDTAFNGTGYFTKTATAGATTGSGNDQGNGVAIDGSGNIVVVGQSTDANFHTALAVWRLLGSGVNAGHLDTAFNGTGYFTKTGSAGSTGSSSSQTDIGRGVVIDGQGNIVVAGSSKEVHTGTAMAVWRLLGTGASAGTVDTTFNGSGIYYQAGATGRPIDLDVRDFAWALALDPQGNIVVAGKSQNNLLAYRMVVWRLFGSGGYTGGLDTSFGNHAGYSYVGAANSGDDLATGVAIGSDGRIVVAGQANVAGNQMTIWMLK